MSFLSDANLAQLRQCIRALPCSKKRSFRLYSIFFSSLTHVTSSSNLSCIYLLFTHLLNRFSNNGALCGNASASKSNGISATIHCSEVGPSRFTKCAASTNCRPSHNTESRRSTWLAFNEPLRSSLLHKRILPRLFMLFTCSLSCF